LPALPEAVNLLIEEALERSGGNQSLAARLIGISQPALSKRLKAGRK
jgi:DNA-binding protein Fis